MGGPGSGMGYRLVDRKRRVKESLVLSTRQFRRHLGTDTAGAFAWRWASGQESAVLFALTWGEEPVLTLAYKWRDASDIRIRVPLQATPMRFGGFRWWFTCPLLRYGWACGRRVAKLYLPPGGRYFGRRHCHDLSYKSAQEAHQLERVLSRIGLGPDDAHLFSTWDDYRG